MNMQAINKQIVELKDYVKKRFDKHDKCFNRIEGSLDTQARKLLEHDDRFKGIDDRFEQMHREVIEGQDKMMKILVRLDQERTFCHRRFERHEAEIKKLGGFKDN